MGRWLARLQQEEKNVNPPGDETLKTFETPSDEVLRVLKVSYPREIENFSDSDGGQHELSRDAPTRSQPTTSAGRFEDRPANWMPEPGPGVTILRPAAELPAIEYDGRLDRLIAALPTGSVEAQRLIFAKRKGWVVECEGRWIFTRGRF